MDILIAAVGVCTTGRATVKIREISQVTGLERADIYPTLRFLTAMGQLSASSGGWRATQSTVAIVQLWEQEREAAQVALSRAWSATWPHARLLQTIKPGQTLAPETLADRMRPHRTARLRPWITLVDWLELAGILRRNRRGHLRLADGQPKGQAFDQPPGHQEAVAGESPAEASESTQPGPASHPQGLVLPIEMSQLCELPVEDYAAVMRSVATIYEVLSRQRT